MEPIRVRALQPRDIRPTFALLQLRHPDLAFAGWSRMARRALNAGSTLRMLVATDPLERVHGLCTLVRVPALAGPSVLVAHEFVAIDPIDPTSILGALRDAAAAMAVLG